MRRIEFIERCLRQIYGDNPNDDSSITYNLVNSWLQDATAVAAKQNNKENIALEGISFTNNSFYTTFKGLTITYNDRFLYRVTLPQIPLGIGTSDGVSTAVLKDTDGAITYPIVLISQNQRTYSPGMRPIPNKLIGYIEGEYMYLISTYIITDMTASVTMISAGDSTDLNSTLNVPSDYFPIIVDYIKQQLLFEKTQPVDTTNNGKDVNPEA